MILVVQIFYQFHNNPVSPIHDEILTIAILCISQLKELHAKLKAPIGHSNL